MAPRGNPNMKVGAPTVNKRGRPPGVFHTFADTASRLLEAHSRDEILAIADSDERLSQLRSFESMVLLQLANSLRRGDLNLTIERERMYDRIMGKAAQQVNINQETTVNINYFKAEAEAEKLIESMNYIEYESVTNEDS